MPENYHSEKHRQVAGGWYRATVFGASDGLVTNASLILGFAVPVPATTSCDCGLAGLVAAASRWRAGSTSPCARKRAPRIRD